MPGVYKQKALVKESEDLEAILLHLVMNNNKYNAIERKKYSFL